MSCRRDHINVWPAVHFRSPQRCIISLLMTIGPNADVPMLMCSSPLLPSALFSLPHQSSSSGYFNDHVTHLDGEALCLACHLMVD